MRTSPIWQNNTVKEGNHNFHLKFYFIFSYFFLFFFKQDRGGASNPGGLWQKEKEKGERSFYNFLRNSKIDRKYILEHIAEIMSAGFPGR